VKNSDGAYSSLINLSIEEHLAMKENLGAGYGWQALAQAKWLNQFRYARFCNFGSLTQAFSTYHLILNG